MEDISTEKKRTLHGFHVPRDFTLATNQKPKMFFPVENVSYTSLWNKYRPMVLQLMSAAVGGPQQYKLSGHEFKAMGEKVKTGYAFSLEAANGKAINNIKGSNVAKDLLQVLQQSRRASQLMSEATYELSLDKHFVFQVNRKEVKEVATPGGDDTLTQP